MHRHQQFQGLHPLDRYSCGILPRQVIQFGAVFPGDGLGPLFLPRPLWIALRQHDGAAHRLVMQVVVVPMQSVLVAGQTPAQPFHERIQRHVQARWQRPSRQFDHARPIPHGRQIGLLRCHLVGFHPVKKRTQGVDDQIRQSAGCQVDADPADEITFVVRNRGRPEIHHQIPRPGRRHPLQPERCVIQQQFMAQHAFRIVRRLRLRR